MCLRRIKKEIDKKRDPRESERAMVVLKGGRGAKENQEKKTEGAR